MSRNDLIQELFVAFETMRFSMMPKSGSIPDDLPPPAQARLLFQIFENYSQNGASIKELAGQMKVSSSAITQMVDGLVESGYLTRQQSQEDRRQLIVKASPQAVQKMDLMKNALINSFQQKTKHLTDLELKLLLQLVQKINN
jgi:DNA-binding MarR family transcriptional regulator